MRATVSFLAVLAGILAASSARSAETTRDEGYKECTKTYDRCIKRSDDSYEGLDNSQVSTRDHYEQLLDTCKAERRWCERDVEKTTASEDDDNDSDPSLGRPSNVPEPIDHYPTGRGPRIGGYPKD
jgi:hypothetical protein